MVPIPTQPSNSRVYPNRCYLGTLTAVQQLLERHSNRNTKPNPMRRTLAMTTCRCEHVSEPLVISRQLLTDTIKQNRQLEKAEVITEVNTIIQDLRTGDRSDDYDAGYDDALDQIIRSINKLLSQENN
jgi:hypothetical protein